MPFGRACGPQSVFSGVSKSHFLPEREKERGRDRFIGEPRPERDKFDRPHFSCAAASNNTDKNTHSAGGAACGAAIFATYATSFLFVHSARRHRRRISLVL